MKNLLNALIFLVLFFSSCQKQEIVEEAPFAGDNLTLKGGSISAKKGIGLSKWLTDWSYKASESRVHWHYSWREHLCDLEPDNVEFVPMIWEGRLIDDTVKNQLIDLKNQGKINYLLGFNEPDGVNQANMTVDEAIAKWPELEAVGLPLGSPAAVNAENAWMQEFMARASANGLRVDFVTVHWYGAPDPVAFLNKLASIYNRYGKPIWITEFAPADWQATTPAENRYTPDQVLQFMRDVLPQLESLPYIERYAWFPANINSGPLTCSALWDDNGNLTKLGKAYANCSPNVHIGPGKDRVFTAPLVYRDDFECYAETASLKDYGYTVWGGNAVVNWGYAYEGKQFGQSNATLENFAFRRTFTLTAGKTYRLDVATRIQDGAKHVIQVNPQAAYGSAWLDCYNADWVKHSTQFTVTPGNEQVTVALYRWPLKLLSFDDLSLTEVP